MRMQQFFILLTYVLLTKTFGIAAISTECIQRSKENLAAASEPKKEKYKGSDNTPVITNIKLLTAKQERQPNAILDFPPITADWAEENLDWLFCDNRVFPTPCFLPLPPLPASKSELVMEYQSGKISVIEGKIHSSVSFQQRSLGDTMTQERRA